MSDKYEVDFPIRIRCADCDYPLDCSLEYSDKQRADERAGYFIMVERCKHCTQEATNE